ncbi:MAG: hypothetical protein JXA97_06545 [Anaerolineales bacterium]|nr:hypothetical protein [Anaerolineales bacterium]
MLAEKYTHEKIIVQWTLRSAGGLTLGIGMAALLTITLSWPGAFIGVPLAGMLLGMTQASYLKRFLAMGSEWLWATTMSVTIGIAAAYALLSISSTGVNFSLQRTDSVDFFIGSGIIFLLALPLFGFIVGLGQWIALRKHVAKAGYWILANSAGYLIAVGLLIAMILALAWELPAVAYVLILSGLPAYLAGITLRNLLFEDREEEDFSLR